MRCVEHGVKINSYNIQVHRIPHQTAHQQLSRRLHFQSEQPNCLPNNHACLAQHVQDPLRSIACYSRLRTSTSGDAFTSSQTIPTDCCATCWLVRGTVSQAGLRVIASSITYGAHCVMLTAACHISFTTYRRSLGPAPRSAAMAQGSHGAQGSLPTKACAVTLNSPEQNP